MPKSTKYLGIISMMQMQCLSPKAVITLLSQYLNKWTLHIHGLKGSVLKSSSQTDKQFINNSAEYQQNDRNIS